MISKVMLHDWVTLVINRTQISHGLSEIWVRDYARGKEGKQIGKLLVTNRTRLSFHHLFVLLNTYLTCKRLTNMCL